jgi:predicted transcriptional regulator
METDHYAFVLVLDQNYWDRLCGRINQGKETRFFVRGNAVGPLNTQKLLFYVTKPHMQVLGEADFVQRIIGPPQDLWSQYGAQSIFESQEEFENFAGDRKQLTFIEFTNFSQIPNPQSKETVHSMIGPLSWFKPKYVNQKITGILTNQGIS